MSGGKWCLITLKVFLKGAVIFVPSSFFHVHLEFVTCPTNMSKHALVFLQFIRYVLCSVMRVNGYQDEIYGNNLTFKPNFEWKNPYFIHYSLYKLDFSIIKCIY